MFQFNLKSKLIINAYTKLFSIRFPWHIVHFAEKHTRISICPNVIEVQIHVLYPSIYSLYYIMPHNDYSLFTIRPEQIRVLKPTLLLCFSFIHQIMLMLPSFLFLRFFILNIRIMPAYQSIYERESYYYTSVRCRLYKIQSDLSFDFYQPINKI